MDSDGKAHNIFVPYLRGSQPWASLGPSDRSYCWGYEVFNVDGKSVEGCRRSGLFYNDGPYINAALNVMCETRKRLLRVDECKEIIVSIFPHTVHFEAFERLDYLPRDRFAKPQWCNSSEWLTLRTFAKAMRGINRKIDCAVCGLAWGKWSRKQKTAYNNWRKAPRGCHAIGTLSSLDFLDAFDPQVWRGIMRDYFNNIQRICSWKCAVTYKRQFRRKLIQRRRTWNDLQKLKKQIEEMKGWCRKHRVVSRSQGAA